MLSVLIYGCGVMGRAVARTFIRTGFQVTVKVRDLAQTSALDSDIKLVDTLPATAPDLIIEFVPEDLSLTLRAFADIESHYSDQKVIIATGTSGLDLEALSKELKHPELFLGIHYFMPADVLPVVEVMAGPCTAAELVDDVADLIIQTGKMPIRLYKPSRGYLLNRLQHAILLEAYSLIEDGIASVKDIDDGAKYLLGPRMCISGLIRKKDISGLKSHAEAQRSIVRDLWHNNTPNPMLQEMVARGETGLNAGVGFYKWINCNTDEIRDEVSDRLKALMDDISSLDAANQSKNHPVPCTSATGWLPGRSYKPTSG